MGEWMNERMSYCCYAVPSCKRRWSVARTFSSRPRDIKAIRTARGRELQSSRYNSLRNSSE